MSIQDQQITTGQNGWMRIRDWLLRLPLPLRALLVFAVLASGVGLFVWLRGPKSPQVSALPLQVAVDSSLYKHSYERKLSQFLAPEMPDTLPPIEFDAGMLKALYEQASYLRRPDVKKMPVNGIGKAEMLETVERLQSYQLVDPHTLLSTFDFYRVQTDLNSDKVRVTGYYTPIMMASRTRQGPYQWPIYQKPSGNIPPPAAIWNGALEGRKLELCWVKSKKEVKNAQLQGSCLVEFPDGKRQFLGHGGSVRGGGSNYVFFVEVDDVVLGAGYFPVTALYTLAVDTRFIPLGATLLAELPEIAPGGKQVGTTYRILFAQDRGGAIKTTKRIDLYSGIGRKGLEEARRINRYARLWLMLPKKRKTKNAY
ncbi:MAG: MltA domain-containing protein [Lewinellaceae bacterium]|nr:MltA domain-containing protein [Lewinellaceae bacterium]